MQTFESPRRFFGLCQRSGATRTFQLPGRTDTCQDPIRTLRQLRSHGDDIVFDLDALWRSGVPRRWLGVGSAEHQPIQIASDAVSATHCMLYRDPKRGWLYLTDLASYNGTFANSMRILDGFVELPAGSLIRLGDTILLACGRAGAAQKPILTGQTLVEFLRNAIEAYGSQKLAGKAIAGLTQTTLSRWLQRFGVTE